MISAPLAHRQFDGEATRHPPGGLQVAEPVSDFVKGRSRPSADDPAGAGAQTPALDAHVRGKCGDRCDLHEQAEAFFVSAMQDLSRKLLTDVVDLC